MVQTNVTTNSVRMFSDIQEKYLNDDDFSSIVASSLRTVIENSVTDLVLPYRVLSISHLSSWNTFQNDLNRTLQRNCQIDQNFLMFNHLNFHENSPKMKQKEDNNDDDRYFQCLINSNIDFIPMKSDFDRLRQLMYTS